MQKVLPRILYGDNRLRINLSVIDSRPSVARWTGLSTFALHSNAAVIWFRKAVRTHENPKIRIPERNDSTDIAPCRNRTCTMKRVME